MDRRIMSLADRQRFARVGNNAARDRDDYSLGVAFDRDRMIRAGDFDRLRLDLDILFHSGHLWLSSCAGLRRRLAAVDEEHLTGRKGRLARSEEDDRVRNLVGLACTLERNTFRFLDPGSDRDFPSDFDELRMFRAVLIEEV